MKKKKMMNLKWSIKTQSSTYSSNRLVYRRGPRKMLPVIVLAENLRATLSFMWCESMNQKLAPHSISRIDSRDRMVAILASKSDKTIWKAILCQLCNKMLLMEQQKIMMRKLSDLTHSKARSSRQVACKNWIKMKTKTTGTSSTKEITGLVIVLKTRKKISKIAS